MMQFIKLQADNVEPANKRSLKTNQFLSDQTRLKAQRRKSMCFETQYFYVNRILLLALGIWSPQKSKLVRLQLILLYSIFMSFIVFQLTAFVTAEWTLDLYIKILSTVLMFITLFIQYISFCYKSETMRYFLKQLRDIYSQLKDENEIFIMDKCGLHARRYTIALTLLAIIFLLIANVLQLWPRIHGIIRLPNNSRSYSATFLISEYFVDQEKYYYLIVLHMNAALWISAIAVVGIGTIITGYLQSVCGIFMIASYRIEQAMISKVQQGKMEKEMIIYQNMICAINIHRKAMWLSEGMVSKFEGMFLSSIICGIVCLSLFLFRIVSNESNMKDLFLCLIFVTSIVLYIFLANHAAQEITDYNNHVFMAVYNVQWYIASIPIQKMILFLLQRGNKAFTLNIGGLFVASLEAAAMMASTAVSYFTVLYSTQR